MDFKTGDEVVCITTMGLRPDTKLVEGMVYTVASNRPNSMYVRIRLPDGEISVWYARRFILHTGDMNPETYEVL